MEKLRVESLGGYFVFEGNNEFQDLQITTMENSGFDENHNFYVKDYNCRIKLGKRRYIQTYINPDDCKIRYYNGSNIPVVYIMEKADLSETKKGFCFDAVKFLNKHQINFELCEDERYMNIRANSTGYEDMVCPNGSFYAGYTSSWWDSGKEYSLEAVFFERQLILDGEAIRKIWIPEYNDTNELKYINADHTLTEQYILQMFDEPVNTSKNNFTKQLLENDTLGIIIVYTWDGKRYDLINLKLNSDRRQ